MSGYLWSADVVTPYGEWGCHRCSQGRRDVLPETADRDASEHLQNTGHDVFVVRGVAQAFHAVSAEVPA